MHPNNREKNRFVRKQILKTLLEMMREQDFRAISISGLTERACVGRASFYRNYAGKEDVLRQEAQRLTWEWKREFERRNVAAPDEILISMLDFFKEHADFYLALHGAGMAEIVLEAILEQFEIAPELSNAMAYLKSSIAYMLYGWIIEWMNRGMQESGTELARMFAEAQRAERAGLENGFAAR